MTLCGTFGGGACPRKEVGHFLALELPNTLCPPDSVAPPGALVVPHMQRCVSYKGICRLLDNGSAPNVKGPAKSRRKKREREKAMKTMK